MMNYTDSFTPFTRTVEHKHFDFIDSDVTWVTWEYPQEYIIDETEPHYPVNDIINNEKYNLYKKKSSNLKNIFFGGRLAEYKYYDMDDIIESCLEFLDKLK